MTIKQTITPFIMTMVYYRLPLKLYLFLLYLLIVNGNPKSNNELLFRSKSLMGHHNGIDICKKIFFNDLKCRLIFLQTASQIIALKV